MCDVCTQQHSRLYQFQFCDTCIAERQAACRGCRRPVDIANMATPAEHFVQYFKQRGITSLIDNAEVEDADAEVDIEDAEVVIVAWSGYRLCYSLFKFPRDAADALQQCKGVAFSFDAGSGLLQTEKACSCGSGF